MVRKSYSKRIVLTRSIAAFFVGGVFLAPAAYAQLYWDNDGATAGFGSAAGTWAAPTINDATQGWSLDPAGTTLPAGTTTTMTTDALNFGNGATGLAAGTITVSGMVDSGDISFALGSGAIVLSGGTINLAAAPTITVNNATNTIDSILSGAATSLTKAGTGTLVLNQPNTFGGGLNINVGTVVAGNNTALSSGTVTLGDTNTILEVGNGINLGNALVVSDTGDNKILRVTAGTGTYAGNIDVQETTVQNFDVSAALNTTLRLTGVLSGGGSVDSINDGTIEFAGSAANTFSGGFNLGDGAGSVFDGATGAKHGFVLVHRSDALGTGGIISRGSQLQAATTGINIANTIEVNNGGLRLGGSNSFEISGAINVVGGTRSFGNYGLDGVDFTLSGGINTFDGTARAITFDGSDGKDNGDWIVSGAIISGGAVTVGATLDNGVVTLSANNDYGTTTISAGTLQIGAGGTTGTLGAGNVTNNSALIFNRSNPMTVSNVISGTGTLTKLGGNTLTLDVDNTYSGDTTISAGLLQVGTGGAVGRLGNGTGNVINNAALEFNTSDNNTYSGIFSGTGTLAHNGTGTTTLSGNNTYTGATSVNFGTLAISGTNTSNITVASGANLDGEGNTTGTLLFSGSTHTINIDATTAAALGSTGAGSTNVSALTNGMFVVNVNGLAVGPVKVLTYGSGGFTGSAAKFALGTGTLTPRGSGFADNGIDAITFDAGLVNNTWTGTTDGVWEIGGAKANWSNGTDTVFYNGDTVSFGDAATTKAVVITGSNVAPQSVTFNNTISNDYTLSSAGAQTLTVAGGIQFTGSGNVTVSSVIAGTTSLTQSGTGTTTITGIPTYSGTTTISAGTLKFVNGAITPARAYGPIAAGATLEFNLTSGNQNGGVISLTGGGTFKKSGANTFTHTSAGSTIAMSSGSVFNVAQGIYVFGGGGIGNWTNNKSDLQVDSGATFRGSATPAVFNVLLGAGTVRFGGGVTLGIDNGSGTFSGVIQNDTTLNPNVAIQNSLTKIGTGTQVLSGNNNTYTGPTTISDGRLDVTGSIVSNVTVANGKSIGGEGTVGSLTFGTSAAANLMINSTTNGTAADRLKVGTGASTLDVTNGVVVLFDVVPTSAAGPIDVIDYGTGTLTGGLGNFSLDPSIIISARPGSGFSDTAGLIQVNLGGVNKTWVGGDGINPTFWDNNATDNWSLGGGDNRFFDGDYVTFADGAANLNPTLQSNVAPGSVTFSNTTGNDYTVSGAFTLTATGGIQTTGSGNVTIGSVIAGATPLNLSGTGTTTLTGANTHTGTTTINSTSTLQVGDGGTLGTGLVVNDGALVFNRTGTLTVANVISGTGTLSQSVGTIVLTGANTYTSDTTVSAGTLNLGASGVIGDDSAVIQTGGTISMANGVVESLHSLQATGGLLLLGSTSAVGSADITLLNNSQVHNLQVGISGILRLAPGVTLTQTATGVTTQVGPGDSLTFDVGAGGLANMTGVINSGDGDGSINKTGSGVLRLTNAANSFGGGTVIENGTLEFNSIANIDTASSLGDADTVNVLQIGSTATGATLKMIGTNAANTSNRAVQLGDAGGTIDVEQAAQTLTLNGIVSNANTMGALTKAGDGTLVLGGVNSYTGVTTISAGKLVVNGSTMSDTTVLANATLGGSGTIDGSVSGAGNVAPGNSLGTLIVNGTYNITGLQQFELDAGLGALAASDQVTGITALTYGGTLQVTANSGSFTVGDSWDLFDFTTQTGLFANDADFGLLGGGGSLPSLGGMEVWDFDYSQGVLSVQAIPEPSTLVLGGLALLGFAGVGLRRRRLAQQQA